MFESNIDDTPHRILKIVLSLLMGLACGICAFGILIKSLITYPLTTFDFPSIGLCMTLIAWVITMCATIFIFKPIINVMYGLIGLSTIFYSYVACQEFINNYKLKNYEIWDNQCGYSLITMCTTVACHMIFNILCLGFLYYKY